jgi:formamidopyrimidine-DNA glycosylase
MAISTDEAVGLPFLIPSIQKLDSIVFAGVEPSEIESSLTGQTIVDTKRWGKYYVLSMLCILLRKSFMLL